MLGPFVPSSVRFLEDYWDLGEFRHTFGLFGCSNPPEVKIIPVIPAYADRSEWDFHQYLDFFRFVGLFGVRGRVFRYDILMLDTSSTRRIDPRHPDSPNTSYLETLVTCIFRFSGVPPSPGGTAAAATAEEFFHHHQPQSYHARGSNIPFGFPLTPITLLLL